MSGDDLGDRAQRLAERILLAAGVDAPAAVGTAGEGLEPGTVRLLIDTLPDRASCDAIAAYVARPEYGGQLAASDTDYDSDLGWSLILTFGGSL